MFRHVTTIGYSWRGYKPPQLFGIEMPDRLLHTYIIGQTGTGKSTLLANLAEQDAQAGIGFCLIDPHGDLALRLHDTLTVEHIYWDVPDPACPHGYNPLTSVSAPLRPLIASGLIDTMKKQWKESWGARMEHLLRYAILALLDYGQGDLRDIVRLFVMKDFRRKVVAKIEDEQTLAFWREEYPNMNYQNAADGVAPIANKVGSFLAHPTVRKALCHPEAPIRFRRLMDTGRPLIVNLAKGRLGTDISNILGGLIIASMMNAAFTRHDLIEDARRPFFLYVDEFHAFTTTAFASLMAEARKYRLGITLAQQHLVQTETAVLEAILGNVGTQIVFRVGPRDAPTFERQLPGVTFLDLINQPNYRAYVQLMVQGQKTRPFSATLPPTLGAPYPAHGYPGA